LGECGAWILEMKIGDGGADSVLPGLFISEINWSMSFSVVPKESHFVNSWSMLLFAIWYLVL